MMSTTTYMPSHAEIEREMLKRPVMFSAIAHVALAVAGIAATLIRGTGEIWGDRSGGGGTANVRLVSSASIPLPAPKVATQNTVATENKGLNYPELPKPAQKAPPKQDDPKTIDLPSTNAKVTPPKKTPEKVKEEPPKPRKEVATTGKGQPTQEARLRKPPVDAPPAGNEIPYGQGGPVQGPYGAFQTDGGSGGINVVGGSDFGSRYSSYVTAIRQRISNNWLQSSIEPNIRVAPRVFVSFQIMRDGRVVNPQLSTASGISSLDRSVLRAVYDSSPMLPLPPGYTGSSVTVEFWFDFKR